MSWTARRTISIRAMCCKGVLDRYAKDGLTPVVACELEYYLVDIERGHDGELMLAKSLQYR
jgi:glutamine synthetase